MTAIGLVGLLAVLAAAVWVFLQFARDAQAAGLIPTVLGEWTIGYTIVFFLNVAFWELVLVGSWSIPLALIAYFRWYKRLPAEERAQYEDSRKKDHDGISFVATMLWLAIAWFFGLWDKPFGTWNLNEWIHTWLLAWGIVLGVAIVFGGAYAIYQLVKDTA